MAPKRFLLPIFFIVVYTGWNNYSNGWISEKHNGYNLFYTTGDRENKDAYTKIIDNGIYSVNSFFASSYNKAFNVFIHPNRNSLDSTWQKNWNMPGFKSECWMVASGVADRLDMISPKIWDKEACEHFYAETEKTQQLITHELIHVYHGQLNSSPDFSNTEGIDWFVEGLATYASGQFDSSGVKRVKTAIAENKIPGTLDSFWTGNLKYPLSGSLVMFIDNNWKRNILKMLLPLNKKSAILSTLKIQETELLAQWKIFIEKL